MARFYQRGKTWSYAIEAGKTADGKRNRITGHGFKRKQDAKAESDIIEAELQQGTFVVEKDTLFPDFAAQWHARYSLGVKKPTARIRLNEVNNLLKHFKEIKCREITKKQYQDALLDMSKTLAPNTVAGIHGTARMIFKKAVELDVIKRDPTEFARPPRKVETLEDIENENEIPKYLVKKDLSTFLRFSHDAGMRDDYAVFLTLAYTGVRAGELCALKWQDIDFTERTIKITRTYYNPKNNIKLYELLPPKTKSSRRTIHVSDRVIKELELHKARQNKLHMRNRDIWHDEDFVFTADKYPGYPMYVKIIENRMTRLLRIAGLNTELTPHSLRHTHTSLLAQARVTLEEIMDRLGHADDDTTRRVYLHVTKDMKREAAHKFDILMDNL